MLYYLWEGNNGNDLEYRIVLPKVLVPEALKELHDGLTGGHLGIKKTLYKVKNRFFWYGLKRDVTEWCKRCDICTSRKGPYRKAKSAMRQQGVGAPLERIGMDIMGPLPMTCVGNKYILTIVDYFTKWIMAIPIENQEAVTIASKFVEKFVSVFGVPRQIHSDQGSNFESQVFKEMCQILGVDKTRTTPYRPQSDGLVERNQRTIQAMLSKFVASSQRDWDNYLPILTLAYNASVQESTGFSPSMMMFGRDVTLPVDLALGKPEQNTQESKTSFALELENKLEKVHDLARKNLTIASNSQKRLYDHRLNQNVYQVGDMVWLYTPQIKPGLCSKLSRKWTGPFVVMKKLNDVIYRIQLNKRSKAKVVHHDRLSLYKGRKVSWFKTDKNPDECELTS